MYRFANFIDQYVAPTMNKIMESPWVAGLQKAKIRTFPMVLVGSVVSLLLVIDNFVGWLPDFEPIKNYTIGLMSLFMVFLTPYYILEGKRDNIAFIGGCTAFSLYMLLVNPDIQPFGYIYNFEKFGTGGMFVAIVSGLFTSFIFYWLGGRNYFDKIPLIPKSFKESLDALLPIIVTIGLGWFFVIQMDFDLYSALVNLMIPLTGIAQSWYGMVLLCLIPTMMYSMGVNNWIFQPIIVPVVLAAISANATQGAHNIFTSETLIAFVYLGGKGATLSLVALLMRSKHKPLKALGFANIVPSIFNINDPIVYGIIAWNPILMIPMWLNAIVLPITTYVFMAIGLVPVPAVSFTLWNAPVGLSAWYISHSLVAVLFVVVNIIISLFVWYPFYKIYEEQKFGASK